MTEPGRQLRDIEQGELEDFNGEAVLYTVVHGWSPKASLECDIAWKAAWVELFEQIEKAVPEEARRSEILESISTEDDHWDWFRKAINFSTDGFEWFHLYARGKPQAACLIHHPDESALEPGDIFNVKFVSVAPWNRSCDFRPREFRGLGTIILRAAQRFAVRELSLRPGFCLHSLPKAEGFYEKNLGMVKVDGNEDAQALACFELPSVEAANLMETS